MSEAGISTLAELPSFYSLGIDVPDRQCLQRLIKTVGHNEGYVAADPIAQRYAAIDRWIAWWNRTGRAEFIALHPDVADAFPAEASRNIAAALAKLPTMVEVLDPRKFTPITYRVPRADLAKLVAENAIEARGDGDELRFRFRSPEAASQWLSRAKVPRFRAASEHPAFKKLEPKVTNRQRVDTKDPHPFGFTINSLGHRVELRVTVFVAIELQQRRGRHAQVDLEVVARGVGERRGVAGEARATAHSPRRRSLLSFSCVRPACAHNDRRRGQ